MLNCFSCAQLFVTIWTVACQASLSMEFSRQEYWNGLSCPPPGQPPDPEIKPESPESPALGQALSLLYGPTLTPIHDYWKFFQFWLALTRRTFVGKVISLLFNTLTRFVIAFLPGRKHLLISWLQLLSTVNFGVQEKKICHCFHFCHIYCYETMGRDGMVLVFCMLSFKPAFSLSSFTIIKWLFSFPLLSAIKVAICISKVADISLAILTPA